MQESGIGLMSQEEGEGGVAFRYPRNDGTETLRRARAALLPPMPEKLAKRVVKMVPLIDEDAAFQPFVPKKVPELARIGSLRQALQPSDQRAFQSTPHLTPLSPQLATDLPVPLQPLQAEPSRQLNLISPQPQSVNRPDYGESDLQSPILPNPQVPPDSQNVGIQDPSHLANGHEELSYSISHDPSQTTAPTNMNHQRRKTEANVSGITDRLFVQMDEEFNQPWDLPDQTGPEPALQLVHPEQPANFAERQPQQQLDHAGIQNEAPPEVVVEELIAPQSSEQAGEYRNSEQDLIPAVSLNFSENSFQPRISQRTPKFPASVVAEQDAPVANHNSRLSHLMTCLKSAKNEFEIHEMLEQVPDDLKNEVWTYLDRLKMLNNLCSTSTKPNQDRLQPKPSLENAPQNPSPATESQQRALEKEAPMEVLALEAPKPVLENASPGKQSAPEAAAIKEQVENANLDEELNNPLLNRTHKRLVSLVEGGQNASEEFDLKKTLNDFKKSPPSSPKPPDSPKQPGLLKNASLKKVTNVQLFRIYEIEEHQIKQNNYYHCYWKKLRTHHEKLEMLEKEKQLREYNEEKEKRKIREACEIRRKELQRMPLPYY